MLTIHSRFGEVPQSEDDAYLSFPVALEVGKVDPNEVELVDPVKAAISINNGIMPKQGSVFEVNGLHGALDLTAVERATPRELILLPSTKKAVNEETGEFVLPGVVLYSTEDGRLKLTTAVDRPERADWSPYYSRVGKMAIYKLGLEAPMYDAVEIDPNGIVVGRKPTLRKYFV